MNPGLPGAGIAGLFYILAALWMPLCEVWRRSRGKATGRWLLVAKQFAIAMGVVAAMGGIFWVLDSAVILYEATQHMIGKAQTTWSIWSLRFSALLTTAGVLATLLSVVYLARLFLWLRARPANR